MSKRDKRLLAGISGGAALAATIFGIAFAGGSGSPSDGDCVVVDVPSTMGGATLRQCGAAARAFCHDQGRLDQTIAAACRRQGFAIEIRR